MTRTIALAAFLSFAAGGAFAGTPAITGDHLNVADLNGDGKVELTEYRVMTSNVFILLDADASDTLTQKEASAIPAELFVAMDTDKDGVVSRAEYDVQVLADFRAADVDGNGLLN
ncbi:MAG: hypothetical protein U1E59_10260 [Amaricoccus sp.]